VRLSVGKCERAAPRAAKHKPLLDAELFANLFDILDEMPRRIVFKRSMRAAAACATLFEENHAVGIRIKEAPIIRHETRARPAMQKHDWLSIRRTTLFVIKLVNRRHSNMSAVVWLDLVVKRS
jgi:hypothetical protein